MRRRSAAPLATLLLLATALPGAAQSPSPSIAPSPAASGPSPLASPPVAVPPSPAVDPMAPLTWTLLDVPGPPAREDHTLTVDPDGTAAWLFGGRDGDRAFADLWRLDLATDTWQRQEPAGDRPGRRFGHTATWLPGVGLVVFGGQRGADFFDDLWAFDPAAGAWTRLPDEGRRPEARYGTCAGVGPDGRLWISHGFTASGRFGDTRAWDPATGRWSVQTPGSGNAPGERCLHDCLWAPDGRLLLYGGQDNGAASLADAWALDPAADRWTRLADPAPGARRLYAITSDGTGSAWLFGGADERSRYLADLWHWDLAGQVWTRVAQPGDGPRPSARLGATLVTDAARGRLLLLGGEDRDGRSGELWVLAPADPAA